MLCSQPSFNKCKNIRLFANVALKENASVDSRCPGKNVNVKNIAETKNVDVRNYEHLPGPKGIFGIGTFYHYFPIVGMQINLYKHSQILYAD